MDRIELPHHHGKEPEIVQEQLQNTSDFKAVAEVFRQLSDPTRIRVFWLLCHCEECVINISALMEMSSPAVSHHLRPLKNSGLILSRRVGKEVYYRAADTEQSRLLHQMIEQVMEITCPQKRAAGPSLCRVRLEPDSGEYQLEQMETIRRVHDYMVAHMDQKITIEALSKQYLINPTTLKETFKAVYGMSVAAHIKKHRMNRAAELLRETDLSIAEIARTVGYNSQSRFTTAFKAFFQVLPKEFRK